MRTSHKALAPPVAAPSRQQRRTEATRERLLDAALQVFLERGYDGASPGLVTERADLGTGTFYIHFKDRRAVYEAVVRRRVVLLRDKWSDERALLETGGDPAEEISLMIRMVAESLLSDAPYARFLLFDGPPVETWLVDELGKGIAEVIGVHVSDAEFVAHLVIGSTIAATRWALSRPDAIPARRAVKDAVAFCAAGVAATSEKSTPASPRRGTGGKTKKH